MPGNFPEGRTWEQAKKEALSFVRIQRPKPGQKIYIVVLALPTSYDLHYLEDAGGSVPHYATDCPYCPRPTRVRWYGPGALLSEEFDPNTGNRKSTWSRCIYELTHSNMFEIADDLKPGSCIELSKAKNQKAAQKVRLGQAKDTPAIPPWDIRENLFRIWRVPQQLPKREEVPDGQILKFKTG